MNISDWIGAGVSGIVGCVFFAMLGFGGEIISIHVRIAQSKKKLDDVLKGDKRGIRISFIPLTAILLYDLIKGLPLWNLLAVTMFVFGAYGGIRWTENKRER